MSEPLNSQVPPPGRPVDAGYQLQWSDEIPTDFSFSNIADLPTQEMPSLLTPEDYRPSPDAPPLQEWAPGLPALTKPDFTEHPSGDLVLQGPHPSDAPQAPDFWEIKTPIVPATPPGRVPPSVAPLPPGPDQETQQETHDHFNWLFNDPEAAQAFQQQSVAQAIGKLSPEPLASFYDAANAAYLSATFDPSAQGVAGRLLQSAYTQANGLPALQGKALFDHIGQDIKDQAERTADLAKFNDAAALAALDQTNSAQPVTPEAFIQRFVNDHPSLANSSDRQMILGTLAKSYQAESAWVAKNGGLVHTIFNSAREPDERGGVKAVEVAMVAGLLKRAAPQDQRKILDLTAAYAEAHPETRAYVGQLIEQAYRGTTQTVNAVDRLRQEHALESELAQREAQLRNGGARSAKDKAVAGARALAMDGPVAATLELARPDLPMEKVPARLQDINEQLAQLQAERQVNLFLDDRVNANRPKDRGAWGLLEQAGIDTADQTHVLLLTALGPVGGVGAIEAMGARSADQLKARYPHMSTDTARVLGAGMASGQFVLGKLEVLKVLNKFPGTRQLLERVGKMSYWRQLAAREGINLLGATAGNELSLLIDSFGQEVANAITGDIENGHEPGTFAETQKHVLALSGMLGLGGIAGRLTKEAARFLGPKISKAVGDLIRQALSRLSFGKRARHEESNGGRPTQDHSLGTEISHERGDSPEQKGFLRKLWEDRAAEKGLRIFPPVKSTPRSDPISGSMDISRVDRRTAIVFKRIFPALDRVLNGIGFPKISVDNLVLGDPKGQFRYVIHKKPEGDKFVPTSIGIKPDGPWLHMTALHETAHPIDMNMLGGGLGYASDLSPKLEAWRKLVNATSRIKEMRLNEAKYKKFLPYHEIFARSFAQYVAMRTGDKVLLREVEAIRRHDESFKVWDDQEFWPIAAELDRIFETEGLN